MSLRKIYILTILLCSVWSVSRVNAQSLAEQAGMAYQKGDYAKAVELYEQSGEQPPLISIIWEMLIINADVIPMPF